MLESIRKMKLCLVTFTVAAFLTGTVQAEMSREHLPPTQQQEGKVIGTVTDELGPVAGASVLVKGTTNGTITDANGQFILENVKNGDVLLTTFLGYATQEVHFKGQSTLTIVLQEDVQALDEVVVVGYGAQKKVNLTGAVSQVSGQDIAAKTNTDVLTALQGQLPGVAVLRSSGQPGAEAAANGIRIRGFSSANDANALILIDGVEGDLRLLNAEDIESVSVLKDAAAASIYGARAAAGVVLVTTKKGTAGAQKAKIAYSGTFGFNSPGNMPQRLPPWEEQNLINLARQGATGAVEQQPENASWIGNPNYNYRPNGARWEIFKSTNWLYEGVNPYTTQQNHSLSASGGHGTTQYYVSTAFFQKNGMLKFNADDYKRYSLRATVNSELNKYLKLDIIASYQANVNKQPSSGSLRILELLYNVRGRQSIFQPEEDTNYSVQPYQGDLQANPIDMMQHGGKNIEHNQAFTGNAGLHLHNLVKGLTADLNLARTASYYNQEIDYRRLLWYGKDGQGTRQSVNSNNSVAKTKNYAYQDKLELLINYDLKLDLHAFHLLGGASYEQYYKDEMTGRAYGLLSNDFFSFNYYDTSTATNSLLTDKIEPWKMASLFGRLNYNFNEKYLVEATIRYDGSSRLDPDSRWGLFPSFSAGWRVSEENWFKNVVNDKVDNLKIRASWGKLGNSTVLSSQFYPYYALIENNKTMGNGMYYQTTMVSKDISWEIIQSVNAGLDLGIINNKLNLTADWYQKNNNNMMAAMQVGHIVGVVVPYQNVGELATWGWEVSLQWRDKIGNVNYQVGLNLDDSQNELLRYDGADVVSEGTVKLLQGNPLNTVWGYKTDGYWSSREEYLQYKENNPGYASFNDANVSGGDVKYLAQGKADHTIGAGNATPEDHGDLVNLGTTNPRYLYGINLAAQWKRFDLSMFWQGVGKRNFLVNAETLAPLAQTYEMPWTIHRDYWTPENTDAFWPRLYQANTFNYHPSDKWVQDGSYLRLKNIQLGYTVPIPKSIAQKLQVYLSGSDIWEYTHTLDVFDPEAADDVSSQKYYPFFRTWSVGINLIF